MLLAIEKIAFVVTHCDDFTIDNSVVKSFPGAEAAVAGINSEKAENERYSNLLLSCDKLQSDITCVRSILSLKWEVKQLTRKIE